MTPPNYKSSSDRANEMGYFKQMWRGYSGKECFSDELVLRRAHSNGVMCKREGIALRPIYWGDDPTSGSENNIKGIQMGAWNLGVTIQGGVDTVYYIDDEGKKIGVDFSGLYDK